MFTFLKVTYIAYKITIIKCIKSQQKKYDLDLEVK